MIRAIIVDDERAGRETLADLLRMYCPEVDVVASAESVQSAMEAMRIYGPDLVFLDVEMPLENGFNLLEKTADLQYDVIFTTAYDQYAIPAIKSNALDYLLKPIDRDELIAAVEKAGARSGMKRIATGSDMATALKNLDEWKGDQKKITLSTSEGVIPVRVQDIIRCRAEANYTRFYLSDHKEILVSRTLKNFEMLLAGSGFVRIHYSHLVNIRHVTKYLRSDGGQVLMSDGTMVMVSRRRKDELMRKLTQN